MSEVIDVITRFSYIAEDEGIKKSSDLIVKNTAEIEKLLYERVALGEKQKQLAKDDIAGQQAIFREIQKVENAIRTKTKTVINERVANQDLNKELVKEIGLLTNITLKLDALKTKKAMAQTAGEVRQVNKEIEKLERQLASLEGGTGKGGGTGLLGAIMGGFGLGVGLTTVEGAIGALTALSARATAEFQDSQKTALDLQRSLNVLGKGRYFDGLLDEADRLASSFHNLFDNDDIIKAQTQLVNYGKLSRNEIAKLTPVILELATAEGIDLVQATEKVINILEGRGGQTLRDYGISVKGIKTEHDRLNVVLGDFQTKLKGSADVYAETAQGIEQTNKVLLASIEEQIGEYTSKISLFFKKAELGLFNLVKYMVTSNDELKEMARKDTRQRVDTELAQASDKDLYNREDVEVPFLQERVYENRQTKAALEDQKARTTLTLAGLRKSKELKQQILELDREIIKDEVTADAIMAEAQRRREKLDDKPLNPNATFASDSEKDKADKADKGKTEEQQQEELYNNLLQLATEYYQQNLAYNEQALNEQLINEDEYKQQAIEDEIGFIDRKIYLNQQFNKSIVSLELERIKKLNAINSEDRKNQLAQLSRLDKEIDDYNKKTDANFVKQATDGAKRDEQKRKDIENNFEAIRKYRERDVDLQRQFSEAGTFAERKEIKRRMDMSELEYETITARNSLIADSFSQIGNVVMGLGDAINYVTQLQIDSTDKEIRAQQGRIERAKKYAERGGAELLEIEEQRLAQLEEKRERFARRQLIINNALALSNAIVAVATTAAESGVGSIVTIPLVLGALAAGYAFVTSLTEPQYLADGTKFVQGPGTSRSDSIPAMLSKGERVMDADRSGKFNGLLNDIQDDRFKDQDDLINQITTGVYGVPMNYKGIIDSKNTSTTGTADSKLLVDINSTLKRVQETIEDKPVPYMTADENGLNIFFSRLRQRQRKQSKY